MPPKQVWVEFDSHRVQQCPCPFILTRKIGFRSPVCGEHRSLLAFSVNSCPRPICTGPSRIAISNWRVLWPTTTFWRLRSLSRTSQLVTSPITRRPWLGATKVAPPPRDQLHISCKSAPFISATIDTSLSSITSQELLTLWPTIVPAYGTSLTHNSFIILILNTHSPNCGQCSTCDPRCTPC